MLTELDPLAEMLAHDLFEAEDDLVQLHHLGMDRMAPAEREEAADQGRSAGDASR